VGTAVGAAVGARMATWAGMAGGRGDWPVQPASRATRISIESLE